MQRLFPRFGAWALLLGIGLVCASCASVLGDDFTLQSCSDETSCSSCVQCTTTADCQSEFDDCNANADCLEVLSCISIDCTPGSGYDACIATCEQGRADGTALYRKMTACSCNVCTNTCGSCAP